MSQTMVDERSDQKITSSKITYEEFLVRYDGIRAEWIDGKVELMSPVSSTHQKISGFLFRVLSEFIETYDLGAVFQLEFQMKLSRERRGREPDLFFVAKDNLIHLQPGFFDGPADLVIEIVSPESIERDRVTKFTEYQQGGVREYWLIDPTTQTANFFLLDDTGHYQAVLADTDGIYHSAVLVGLWLRIDWLWQSPTPHMSAIRKELGL